MEIGRHRGCLDISWQEEGRAKDNRRITLATLQASCDFGIGQDPSESHVKATEGRRENGLAKAKEEQKESCNIIFK